MTPERREERRRPRDDDDHEHHGRRRAPRVEIKYTFAVNRRPKPPEVRGDRFRLGEIIATSEGPHQVVEVYWFTATKARVLLRPVKEEKAKKVRKKAQPKKFNTGGAKSSRQPARNKDQR